LLNRNSQVSSSSAVMLPELTPPVSDNLWHHIAVTYDQSTTGQLLLYIDGALQGTALNNASWSWPTNNAQQILLGFSHSANWRAYDGLMDDFRIYNRILTSNEVASVYSSDALVDTNALQLRFNFDTPPAQGIALSWTCGTVLQSASNVVGPYSDVTVASSSWPITTRAAQAYFRTRQ